MKCLGVVFAAILLLVLSVPMLERTSEMPARSSTVYLTSAFTVSPSTWAYVGDTVTFFANATSDSGAATLNFTIYYDYLLANGSINPNSPVSVDTTENPGSINKTYVYNAPGNYTYTDDNQYAVRLVINDGMGGWRNLTRYVTIVEDWAPEFNPNPPLPSVIDWEIGVPLNMSVTCWDNDDDSLTLMWDFGDGTGLAENVTGPALSGVVCNQTHTWNPDPEDLYGISYYKSYYLNLSLTDGLGHWTNTTTEIRLLLPHNFSPGGNISASATTVDLEDVVTIYGNASDPEGEPLTWTFVFNNSVEIFHTAVYHTGLTDPGTVVFQNITHVFSEAGEYEVSLYLSDLTDPELQNDPDFAAHNVSVGSVSIVSINTHAPFFVSASLPNNPTTGDYGAQINFATYVRDLDGDSINVTWEWGDGTFSYNNTPASGGISFVSQGHAYAPPIPPGQDVMELTLNITLDDGNGNTACRSVSVILTLPHNFGPQIDSLLVDGEWPAIVDPGDTVQISASAYDQEGESLTWTFVFNNGTSDYRTVVSHTAETAPGELVWSNVTHVFGSEGRHYVTVNVSDALIPYQVWPHNVSLTVAVDVVLNTAPYVTSTILATPENPVIDSGLGYVEVQYVIETIDVDGDVLTVIWDLGDGSPVVENITEGDMSVHAVRQEHSYFDTGVYNVTVVVTDGRLGHEVARHLLVTITSDNLPPTFVQFSYTGRGVPLPFNYVGDVVHFSLVVTDPEQDPIEFTWDFGDGSPLVVETVSEYVDGNAQSSVNHTYLGPGWFLLTVNYTDNQEGVGGHTSSETEWMQIIEDETSPLADAGPDQVAFVGDVITFDGSGSYDNWAISNYTWTFVYNGTEKTLWGVQPQFQFWTPGLYLVVLNVTDMVGNYNTSSMYVSVYEEIPEFSSAVSVAMTMMLAFVAMAIVLRRRR